MNIKTIGSYSFGPIISAALTLVSLPLTAYIFSQEDIGRFGLLQIISSLIVVIFSLGLDQAYVREYNEVDKRGRCSLFNACILPGLSLLLLFFVILFLFFETYLKKIFEYNNYYLLFLLSSFVFVLFFERFFSVFLRMEEKPIAYSITRIIPKLVLLILLFFVLWKKGTDDFITLSLVHIISWSAVVIVLFYFLRKIIKDGIKQKIEYEKIIKLSAFGIPLILSSLAFWGLSYSDRIFITKYSTLSELGIYTMAVNIAAISVLVQQVFSTIWQPMIYKWIANGFDHEKLIIIGNRMTVVAIVLMTLVGCFSWIIDDILPKNYSGINYIIVVCVMPSFLIVLSEITGIGISIKRKTIYLSFITIMALVVNVICNYNFVPLLGAKGAAISTVIAFYFFFLLKVLFSSWIWIKLPTVKISFSVFILVITSIIFSLCGPEYQYLMYSVWLIPIFISIIFFYDVYLDSYRYIISRFIK
ncbi:lipopolysaccharide biosynthesis protein [Limnobaculum xujianqingii]|uniref:lipopolysaccharide biosynthesis protein n=1 Tax=Limnobaculum xujianqingii TaxID=2738837 RepID=UPI00112ABF3B|nr:oligosaccharide flippase family protein [Limnobaculum xujianqingii]